MAKFFSIFLLNLIVLMSHLGEVPSCNSGSFDRYESSISTPIAQSSISVHTHASSNEHDCKSECHQCFHRFVVTVSKYDFHLSFLNNISYFFKNLQVSKFLEVHLRPPVNIS